MSDRSWAGLWETSTFALIGLCLWMIRSVISSPSFSVFSPPLVWGIIGFHAGIVSQSLYFHWLCVRNAKERSWRRLLVRGTSFIWFFSLIALGIWSLVYGLQFFITTGRWIFFTIVPFLSGGVFFLVGIVFAVAFLSSPRASSSSHFDPGSALGREQD